MAAKEASLLLEDQICFPFYVISKEIIRRYTPVLEPLGLTYTQYIAMMVLWEYGDMTVKALGEKMFLDSGTLSPLVRKLESKGFITKKVDFDDERAKIITLTKRGKDMKLKCAAVPLVLKSSVDGSSKQYEEMKKTLHSIMEYLRVTQ
ncbi:MAG: MarR family transcriptional regulator [Bacilli bacterium]|nr:MarR family transcriptional regulator [Bacilli bacterium]